MAVGGLPGYRSPASTPEGTGLVSINAPIPCPLGRQTFAAAHLTLSSLRPMPREITQIAQHLEQRALMPATLEVTPLEHKLRTGVTSGRSGRSRKESFWGAGAHIGGVHSPVRDNFVSVKRQQEALHTIFGEAVLIGQPLLSSLCRFFALLCLYLRQYTLPRRCAGITAVRTSAFALPDEDCKKKQH